MAVAVFSDLVLSKASEKSFMAGPVISKTYFYQFAWFWNWVSPPTTRNPQRRWPCLLWILFI